MDLKIIRFITIIFVSLSMALSFCHLMQMPARMSYDAQLWRATQSMYQMFGPPVGAIIDVGAVILSIALVFFVRHRHRAFWWTLAGAGLLVAGHAIWWIYINPINNTMVNWTIDTMPADWMVYREQWEYTHVIIAVIKIIGLSALIASVLVETPESQPEPIRTEDRQFSTLKR
jgi:hypothetical protein